MSPPSANSSRRGFLQTAFSSAAAGFAFPTLISGSALGLSGNVSASNRITVAIIGTGNQGFNDIDSFLEDDRVQIVAVCDVNRESPGYWEGKIGGREPAQRLVEERYAQESPVRQFPGLRRLGRLPRNPGPTRYRRRRGLHAGPLARDPGHRRLQGREGHLLPEAAVADRSPRAAP